MVHLHFKQTWMGQISGSVPVLQLVSQTTETWQCTMTKIQRVISSQPTGSTVLPDLMNGCGRNPVMEFQLQPYPTVEGRPYVMVANPLAGVEAL